jgi:hypothetical protein
MPSDEVTLNIDQWFSSPLLIVLDTLRVALIVADLVLIYYIVKATFTARLVSSRLLLFSFSIALVLSMELQFERLGSAPLSWRFFATVLETAAGMWGAWRYLFRNDVLPQVIYIDCDREHVGGDDDKP